MDRADGQAVVTSTTLIRCSPGAVRAAAHPERYTGQAIIVHEKALDEILSPYYVPSARWNDFVAIGHRRGWSTL
jgi:hypothetical protein